MLPTSYVLASFLAAATPIQPVPPPPPSPPLAPPTVVPSPAPAPPPGQPPTGTPDKVRTPDWKQLTNVNNVELSWYTSVETTATGKQAFVYLRVENLNPYSVEGAIGVDVTCKSGATVHAGFDESVIGVLNPSETFGGFPHLYRAVCKPGDTVERVEADARFVPLDPAHVTAPPEPEPNWTPDKIPEPEPPPVTQNGMPLQGPQQLGQFPPRQPPPPPASSRGTLVEVRYGLSVLAIPLQGVTTENSTGFESDFHNTAGGLGPRIGLDVWPYYSRWFSVGINGLIDFATIGLSNGFSYATNLSGGLTLQGGDERFLSGLLKVSEGYRAAHSNAGDDLDEQQSDGSFGGNYTRFAADARLCIDGPHPVGPCGMGADLGFGYDLLGYAANNGGWFVEGAFWMRHHFSAVLEVGWDYAAGGASASPHATPWHNAYVGFGLQFSDMFWNGY